MKKLLLPAVGAIVIAMTAHSSVLGERDHERDEQQSSQNITRDNEAQSKAKRRDRRQNWRRPFSRGREVRSFDGVGNNKLDPASGATFQPFQRLMLSDYSDGIGAMAGPLRKSAREISNIIVDQGERTFPNEYGTSDFLWQWGQFLDHDITLGDGVADPGPNGRDFDIPVPMGDPYFDPAGAGDRVIPFNRAISDPESGTDLENPRKQINEITAWIDGSMVYGSNEERAAALRTHDGTGRLKTSRGALLPFNTDNLPNANGPAPDPAKLFLAGDVRANEQVGLATMHTLFMREHNRWAARIARQRPHFSGDDIYQAARRMVIAEIQIITYKEFLPALIGRDTMPRYRGYQPGNPAMMAEFSGAAYRFGHSAINTELVRLNKAGEETRGGDISLRNAFFNAPEIINRRNALDPILRGLATQKSQSIDAVIVDDLRNFLFGPPGAGGFDLAALNIQRGRDLGLPSYNAAREALGFGRASDFDDISSDPAIQQALYAAYGSVDEIDLWVGGLSEDPLEDEGSQLGPVFQKIVSRQFTALRDHDRFWYERDLTRAERAMLKHVTLARIIHANTNIRAGEIPRKVFYVREKHDRRTYDK